MSNLKSEWSYPIRADKVSDEPLSFSFEASEQERKDLARRLGLVSIEAVRGNARAVRENNKRVVRVEGVVSASVTQNCVISGEPIVQDISDEFEAFFAEPDDVVSLLKVRHERQGHMEGAEQPILDEQDDPEPIIDGMIDLGELATQYLSLSINPYAHKDGYVLEEEHPALLNKDIPQTRKNPFAALKALKEKIDKE